MVGHPVFVYHEDYVNARRLVCCLITKPARTLTRKDLAPVLDNDNRYFSHIRAVKSLVAVGFLTSVDTGGANEITSVVRSKYAEIKKWLEKREESS